jgi:hypothetical protein
LESHDLTTIAIKIESSSNKSLIPNLSKHTCLMEKGDKKKVKTTISSSPKYVSSDEDTLMIMILVMMMNLSLMNCIKILMP